MKNWKAWAVSGDIATTRPCTDVGKSTTLGCVRIERCASPSQPHLADLQAN